MPSLYELPLWLLAAVCVFTSVAFSIAGVLIVRRMDWRLDENDTGTAGTLHNFVGVLYAVALGLMVVSVQSSFGDVAGASVREASAAGDLYRTLGGIADPARTHLRHLTAGYIDLVINEEWPALQRGATSDTAWTHVDDLTRQIVLYMPQGAKEALLYPQLLSDAHTLLNERRTRLFLGNKGIPVTTWIVILTGAVITIGFTGFFRMKKLGIQLVLTSLVATMFGLMIFLISAMNYPLRGQFSVDPGAFLRQQAVLRRLEVEEGKVAGSGSPNAVR